MKFFCPLFKLLSLIGSALFAFLLTTVVVFYSVPAAAGGFYLPTRGVESTGRAGASVAPHRQDLNALWYNPAGLSLIEEFELSLDASLVGTRVEHRRAPRRLDDGSTRTYEAVSNEAPPVAIPSLLIGGTTPLEQVTWAVGAYAPYAGGRRFPADGPQRYVMVDNVGSTLGYLHAGVAWQITDRIAVGAGIQNFMAEFRIVAVGSGYTGLYGDPEDEDLDMFSVATLSNSSNPTANMGVILSLHDRIQTGASVQLGHQFRDSEATLETRMPSHPAYDNADTSGDQIDITVPFPWFARAGVRYLGEEFDVEFALVYQHWSVIGEILADPGEVEVTGLPAVDAIPVPDLVVPQHFRNTVSLHLGGEYSVNTLVDLRAGYVYERSAVPDSRYSVFALDPDKHQVSLGASYDFGAVITDVTGAAIVMPSRQITTSEVRQINPSDPDDERTLRVANGSYDHFGYIFGVGIRTGF